MNWKEIAKKELEKTRELADYISEDFQATQRLREIQEKVEIALNAIKQIEDFQQSFGKTRSKENLLTLDI